MSHNPKEWIGFEPIMRDNALPLQHIVDSTIRVQGGYWRAMSAVARLLEECGEVADAPNGCDFTEECADIIIVSTCIANQLNISLADGYAAIGLPVDLDVPLVRDLSVGFCAMVAAAGQVARGVNAAVGDKPMRTGAEPINMSKAVARVHARAAAIAPERTTPLYQVILHKLELATVRDAGRFTTLER